MLYHLYRILHILCMELIAIVHMRVCKCNIQKHLRITYICACVIYIYIYKYVCVCVRVLVGGMVVCSSFVCVCVRAHM